MAPVTRVTDSVSARAKRSRLTRYSENLLQRAIVETLEPRCLLSVNLLNGFTTTAYPGGALAISVAPTPGVSTPTFTLFNRNPQYNPDGTLAPFATTSPGGLTPAQVQKAYGIIPGVVGDGSGQTIAIVDAYDYPTAAADLHAFDLAFGLPDPPSFTRVNQTGGAVLPGVDPTGGWELEEALDIQWAHAMAPGASIVLVEANSPFDADLVTTAVGYARTIPGVVAVSMSFGRDEASFDPTLNSIFTTPAGHGGVTFLASTGDNGAPGGFPAYSPNVVAVGGTTLNVDASGNYLGETGWSGSGGGISLYEGKPGHQQGVVAQSTSQRTIPDVAFVADPATGVAVYNSYVNGAATPWTVVGGTSLATPCWAGIIAVADQARASAGLNSLNGVTDTLPDLYSAPASTFHDIASGINGFAAGPGYDLVTGRGSPFADRLVSLLAGGQSGGPGEPVSPILGYTPSQIRHAYGIDQVMFGSIVGDGTGQTIAIVDGFSQPNLIDDLHIFDVAFGLPDPKLTIINQNGGTTLPAPDAPGGWGVETTLDVEWAHAMAPGANILLVETVNNSIGNMYAGVKTAANYPGVSVISMSFGLDESATNILQNKVFTTPAGHNGVTFLASTGDNGAFSAFTGQKAANFAAVSPNVVAVGGTNLVTDSNGNYISESAWGNGLNSLFLGGGGGGVSKFQSKPAYQKGVVTQSTTKRAIPDISMDADPLSGVPVYDSFDSRSQPWFSFVGGTSLACPLFAGVMAIANQGRALAGFKTFNGQPTLDGPTQTLPALYKAPKSDFHDITSGNNGFAAGVGYDLATGRGTPIANKLIADLVSYGTTAATPWPKVGSLTITAPSVVSGAAITLSASSVIAGKAALGNVTFYQESNGIPGLQVGSDTLIGPGTRSGSTWSIGVSTSGLAAGTYTYYAQATDTATDPLSSTPVQAVLTVVAPVIGAFTLSPSVANIGQSVLMTASSVTEAAGGTVASLQIYQESNATPGLQVGGDTLVGAAVKNGTTWTLSFDTSGLVVGSYTFYAVATDSAGTTSAASSAALNIINAPPGNNAFASATLIAGAAVTVAGSNVNATRETGEPVVAGDPGGASVWWTWTAPSPGLVTINTTGSAFDTLLGIFTGASVGALTPVATNNDIGGGIRTSSVTFATAAGVTYYIAVDGTGGATGAIQLNLTELVNANDNFANALLLSGASATFSGTNAGGSLEANEPLITGTPGGASSWFVWTPTVNGTVTISTAGSNFATLLAVYTGGSLATLTQVAADNAAADPSGTSSVTFTAIQGVTYYISVDGVNGATGLINLSLNLV